MARREKSWKQIERSRNTRLWITSVWLPLGGMFVTLYAAVPEFRYAVNEVPRKIRRKVNEIKSRKASE